MILRMPRPGRLRMALIALLIGVLGAAPAFAGPQDVLADYDADGSIDQEHSIEDLQRALVEVQDTSLYGAFRDAVQIELNERIGGVRAPASPPAPRSGSGSGAPEGDSTGGAAAPPASEPKPATTTGDGGGTRTETGSTPVAPAGGGDEDPPASPRTRPREEVREGTPDSEDTADVSARDISGLSAGNELPQPPTVAPDDRVPLVFVALSGLAGVLLVGGLASAVYRRTSLRRTPR